MACTVVSKLKTERKTLHISWCTIRTRWTCVARAGKPTLSLFRKIRAPASFLFLVFSFLILRQRKRANSKKYFAVYSNKYPNFSTVQLPALANKSFASESSEASDIYTCQVSRLRRDCHACGSKTAISRLLTNAFPFLTPGGKV